MTTPDTLELRRRAEAAANAGLKSGEWRADSYGLQIWADGLRDGDTHILDIRGWGYLTGRGHGALALAEDEAIAIQRAWQAHVVAFDPATCRALLDRLDALEGREAEVDRITDAFDETLSLSWRRFALARDLAKALTWALAEIDGETQYETEAQRQNCRDKADEVLAAHRAPEAPTTLADEGRDK